MKGSLPATVPAQLVLEESQPLLLTITDLAATPEAYAGQLLQIRGRFESRPLETCGGKSFSWPAWQMAEGDTMVSASGPANLLSALQGAGRNLLVEGYWRHQPGGIACISKTQTQSPWYFDVVRIVSPNPIALLAPEGQESSEASDLTDASGEPDFFPAATITIEGIGPAPAEVGPASDGEAYPVATALPIDPADQSSYPGPDDPTPDASITRQIIASPTASASGRDEPATSSPAATNTRPASGTPEAEASSTPTVPSQETGSLSLLASGSLETGTLQAGQSHTWLYEVDTPQKITIQVAPDADLDLTASILSAEGQQLATESLLSAGEPLVLPEVELLEEGEYEILVSANDLSAGNYAILATNEESYSFIFQGLLQDSSSASASFQPDNDHFWMFSAMEGDSLRVEVSPSGNEDLFFRLFDPQGLNIITLYNESPAGAKEELVDYLLLEEGLYSILVGEQNFGSASYSIIYFIE